MGVAIFLFIWLQKKFYILGSLLRELIQYIVDLKSLKIYSLMLWYLSDPAPLSHLSPDKHTITTKTNTSNMRDKHPINLSNLVSKARIKTQPHSTNTSGNTRRSAKQPCHTIPHTTPTSNSTQQNHYKHRRQSKESRIVVFQLRFAIPLPALPKYRFLENVLII